MKLVPLAVLSGFIFAILWNWVAVPAFGVPALKILTAIGLSLVSAFKGLVLAGVLTRQGSCFYPWGLS